MYGFYKYRAIYDSNNQLVTVIGYRLHWKWEKLLPGFYYGKTKLFYHN